MEVPANPYRSGFNHPSVIDMSRKIVSNFFNIKNSSDLIFTSGSTESLNTAIFGLLQPKHIITTATEHNSVLRPLKTLEKNNGLALSIVPCDKEGFVDIQDIEKEIRKDTTTIIVNHCSNITGAIQDIKSICQLAHCNDLICIVDASQSAGSINIDVEENQIDILAFTGHKSLFATTGIGGLYSNPKIIIKPLKVGGTGIRSDYLYQPEERPLLYEAGTHNYIGIVALAAGIEYIKCVSIEKILQKKQKIYEQIIDGLEEISNVEIIGGKSSERKIPVVNFRIKNMSIEDAGYILNESFDINVRSGLHCAPLIHKFIGSYPHGTIRVSFSHFNTIEEAKYFIESIYKIAKSQ